MNALCYFVSVCLLIQTRLCTDIAKLIEENSRLKIAGHDR
jgi:hypothetical protein